MALKGLYRDPSQWFFRTVFSDESSTYVTEYSVITQVLKIPSHLHFPTKMYRHVKQRNFLIRFSASSGPKNIMICTVCNLQFVYSLCTVCTVLNRKIWICTVFNRKIWICSVFNRKIWIWPENIFTVLLKYSHRVFRNMSSFVLETVKHTGLFLFRILYFR